MEPKIAVTSNEDLLTEILVRLPPKSLLRFKSVSKPWLRLISSTHLRRRSSRRLSKEIPGLILAPIYLSKSEPDCRDCEFIPLQGNGSPPLKRLDFAAGQGKLEVLSHCNGLLLCGTDFKLAPSETRYDCYVFNPTTKDYATVSVNRGITQSDDGKNIPSLCATLVSRDLFIKNPPFQDIPTHRGVYWNGAVNWLSYHKEGLYFNVEEERFGMLPMLPVLPSSEEGDSGSEIFERYVVYLGESNYHLHLIQSCHRLGKLSDCTTLKFDVYEMDRGYSRWSLRFRVDLQTLYGSLPFCLNCFVRMPRRYGVLIHRTGHDDQVEFLESHNMPRRFGVMSVVRRDDDEESFLVVSFPGSVFRYNFNDGSFTKISIIGENKLHDWNDSIPFIESLSTVCVSGNI